MQKYLVIPAFNEQANIPALFDALALTPLSFDAIILADNASTDRTAQLGADRGAMVVHEPQRGYGAACLCALRWIAQHRAKAGGETETKPETDLEADPETVPETEMVIAFLDADLSDDPAELPRLCQPIIDNQADLVIGSRVRLAQPGSLTPTQRFGNALATTLMRLITGQRYTDLGPMRAIRGSSLQQLDMTDRTWGWTIEMQFKAARQKLRIMEFDVPYRTRHAGQSKISGSLIGSIRAGYKILYTIAKLTLKK